MRLQALCSGVTPRGFSFLPFLSWREEFRVLSDSLEYASKLVGCDWVASLVSCVTGASVAPRLAASAPCSTPLGGIERDEFRGLIETS